MKVLLVDYSVGNIFSIRKALLDLGVTVTMNYREEYDGVVLPGVGSYDGALINLDREPLISSLMEKPTLGICLGMQLMFESSEEGSMPGLGLIKGKVVRLPKSTKAPHMGWSLVNGWGRLLNGKGYFYFAHSYYTVPREDIVRGSVDYEGLELPAIVEKGNLFGTQFHPEKSGRRGREVLSNFLEVLKR